MRERGREKERKIGRGDGNRKKGRSRTRKKGVWGAGKEGRKEERDGRRQGVLLG